MPCKAAHQQAAHGENNTSNRISRSLEAPERTQSTGGDHPQTDVSAALERNQSFMSDIERGVRRLDLVELKDICTVMKDRLGAVLCRNLSRRYRAG